MAELKSTIELVMERTRHLVMSDEERAKAAEEERRKRAEGARLALVEQRLKPEEMPSWLGEFPENDREAARRTLARTLVEGLQPGQDNSGPAEALAVLYPAEAGPFVTRIAALDAEYRSLASDLAEQAENSVLDELAARGITGSALQAKSTADPEYAASRRNMLADFQARFGLVKRDLADRL